MISWRLDINTQMTDIAAAMGLAALEELQGALDHRIRLFNAYKEGLFGIG